MDALEAEHDENECRLNFSMSERVAIGRAIEERYGERRGGDKKSKAKNLAFDPNAGNKTDSIAAKQAGFGNPETYRQAKRVVDQGAPELVAAVDAGAVSISNPPAACAIAPGRTICRAAIPSQPLHRRNAPERRRRHLAVSIAQCNLCIFRASSDLYPLNVRQCIARNDSCLELLTALCGAIVLAPPVTLRVSLGRRTAAKHQAQADSRRSSTPARSAATCSHARA
ncbi:hypothetical protein [Accumulibacter sp.]|uniref:hypothetical protein n=1 Tax=Accumulibacter sp. TaxID=2053492 RepID=UPI00258EEB0B|nr:hypothetical protein [Accumulibacter sp.]MCM8578657.1 hypothetical protein [Accumulibacter sp.]